MSTTSSTTIPTDTKVILHWLDKSRSQRILFLLEELSIPYDLRVYKRGADKLPPAELKAVHPLGKSPVIEIQTPGRKPIVIAESALIVEYLCDYWGKSLIPARFETGDGEGGLGQETEAWMRYKYYLNYAEGSLMPYMVMKLVISNIENAPVPFFIKPITSRIANTVYTSFLNPNFKSHFDFLESQLASAPHNGDYFCGELSAVDFLMIFPLEAASGRVPDYDRSRYPRIFAYVEKLHERASYKKAVQRIVQETGSYDASL